eukprot:COSAG02_NODE_3736_length_6305_cov_9.603609_4_plen_60_part_01
MAPSTPGEKKGGIALRVPPRSTISRGSPPVFLFPKMASHDVVSGNKLPNSQLPIGSHDVT